MSPARVVGRHQQADVLAALERGDPVALPLPGGYRLAARPDRAGAVEAMHALTPGGELAVPEVLVGRRQDAAALATEWTAAARHVAAAVWPGPVLIIVTVEGQEWAFGMPDRSLRSLCRHSGSLMVSGPWWRDGAPITSAEGMAAALADAGDGVVLRGACSTPGPTVVDCRRVPTVVREVGAVPELHIEAVLLMAERRRPRFFSRGRSGS